MNFYYFYCLDGCKDGEVSEGFGGSLPLPGELTEGEYCFVRRMARS